MLFNSFDFFIFFPVVTIFFFLLPHRYRWFHLLAASCYFYMAFVPVYILVLFSTIVVDYFGAIFIEKAAGRKRKWFFVLTIFSNLLVLCVFKYYNFFASNANVLIESFGYREYSIPFLNMLLPIGLSFHTFQALSYIIEINRSNIKAEKHFGIYSLYIMFYPQLVAGPIERPQNMVHQFHEKKSFDLNRAIIGLKIMLWGFVKKVVIADRLALYVNEVHYNPASVGSPHLWMATFIFFPFQIYCDFSGYSSIAIGAAKVMGFDLMENFKRPFSSLTTSELWNRWHISLSSWFRDYLYQPLVIFFRDYGKWSVVIGLMITFFLSGLWHGAGWTFITYGLIQGSVIVIEFLLGVKSIRMAKSSFGRIKGLLITYLLFSISLVFFRAQGMNYALIIIKKMFWSIDFKFTSLPRVAGLTYILSAILIPLLVYFERYQLENFLYKLNRPRYEFVLTTCLILAILIFGVFQNLSFIYFQF
jgi:alginate O-acetyltransferase complex protein AlgI